MQVLPDDILDRIFMGYTPANIICLIDKRRSLLWDRLVIKYLAYPMVDPIANIIGVFREQNVLKLLYINQTKCGYITYARTEIHGCKLARLRPRWSNLLDDIWLCDIKLVMSNVMLASFGRVGNIVDIIYDTATMYRTWQKIDDIMSFELYLYLWRKYHALVTLGSNLTGWDDEYSWMDVGWKK
jgi:hypothetical protein